MEWLISATAPAPQTLHGAAESAVSSALLSNIPLHSSYGNLSPLRGGTACIVGWIRGATISDLPIHLWAELVSLSIFRSRNLRGLILPETEIYYLIIALSFQLDERQVLLLSIHFSVSPLFWFRSYGSNFGSKSYGNSYIVNRLQYQDHLKVIWVILIRLGRLC